MSIQKLINKVCFISWEGKKSYDIESLFINRVLNKEYFYGKIKQKMLHQKLVPDSFFILVNNPKQPLHATNSF